MERKAEISVAVAPQPEKPMMEVIPDTLVSWLKKYISNTYNLLERSFKYVPIEGLILYFFSPSSDIFLIFVKFQESG
jgi:hypothetical protein